MDSNPEFQKLVRRDPKWLVSFADLMSLLFAMFVMLLSMAKFDDARFEENAGPISGAFTEKPPASKGKQPQTKPETTRLQIELPKVFEQARALEEEEEPPPQDPVEDVATKLRFVIAEELKDDQVEVLKRDNLVIIRFRDRAAFALGDRELSPEIFKTLEKIADILAKTPGRIRVEGHTDDIPIATTLFRSNWDLSAGRAASVVHHLLMNRLIDPARVSAEGFADSRPLMANETPEHRAMNRRVEISIEIVPVVVKKASEPSR